MVSIESLIRKMRVLNDTVFSIAPDGEEFAIPAEPELAEEWLSLKSRAEVARTQGSTIVVVQGLGFVGSAVAAVVAGTRNSASFPRYFVVGLDLATPNGYWKVARINRGEPTLSSPDPSVAELIREGVCVRKNLSATTSPEALAIADVIVIDLPFDVSDRFILKPGELSVELAAFEQAIQGIGRRMRPEALVIVESTVPIGLCEKVIVPTLQTERKKRVIEESLLLAHAYERVMPGPAYVNSIRNLRRTFSGIDERSARAASDFLASFINIREHPLCALPDTNASEMAKLLENSYRAVNIAFIHEWTLLAEKIGVNLFEVIDSIRVRKGTHDNMRQPGFGVGGYCLTKDPLLAQWSATSLFGTDVVLTMTMNGVQINQRMPLHTFDLAVELAGGSVNGKKIAVCGISYLPEVPDVRNTPSQELVDSLASAGASVLAHDPYLAVWQERPNLPLTTNLEECLAWADGVILATPHNCYRGAFAGDTRAAFNFLVDAQNCVDDATAETLHEKGIVVAGVGKGHWRKRKFHISQ